MGNPGEIRVGHILLQRGSLIGHVGGIVMDLFKNSIGFPLEIPSVGLSSGLARHTFVDGCSLRR